MFCLHLALKYCVHTVEQFSINLIFVLFFIIQIIETPEHERILKTKII